MSAGGSMQRNGKKLCLLAHNFFIGNGRFRSLSGILAVSPTTTVVYLYLHGAFGQMEF